MAAFFASLEENPVSNFYPRYHHQQSGDDDDDFGFDFSCFILFPFSFTKVGRPTTRLSHIGHTESQEVLWILDASTNKKKTQIF